MMQNRPIYDGRPVIGTASSEELRRLLLDQYRKGEAYAMGIAAVRLQIESWRKAEAEALKQSDSLEIFGVDFSAALGAHEQACTAVENMQELLKTKAVKVDDARRVWTWKRLPFTVRQVGLPTRSGEDTQAGNDSGERRKKKAKVEHEEELIEDEDEW